MVPERLGGGWVLAVVIDAVIHLSCRWVHRGLERKWGVQLHRKWEGKYERDEKEEKALPVSHWTYPQLKCSQNRDCRLYAFLKICSCHSTFLICKQYSQVPLSP